MSERKYNTQWGHTFRIVDVWTEAGQRSTGDTPETEGSFRWLNGGELWLCRKHCDGGWVTWRKATRKDIAFMREKWGRVGLEQPEKIGEETE